jgi:hypothetical protein
MVNLFALADVRGKPPFVKGGLEGFLSGVSNPQN